jgi:hypothetical protein
MMYSTRQDLVDAVIKEYNCAIKGHVEQLYNCKAWIFMHDNSDFLILQSYSTIVAAFQWSTGFLWVFDYYSHTTTSHIAKFRNWIRFEYCTGWNWPKIVRLYNDSRTGKRAAKKNLEDDFASVIATALNQSRFR